MNEYIVERIVKRLRDREFVVDAEEVQEVYDTGAMASRSDSDDLVVAITRELVEYGVL